jgi:hypothetical protein
VSGEKNENEAACDGKPKKLSHKVLIFRIGHRKEEEKILLSKQVKSRAGDSLSL